MVAETSKVHAIYRYPVKGLSPEPLEQTTLTVRETLPADHLYAVENGPSGFDPAAPRHQPKQRYLMLMRNERLARLHTRFDDASHTLVIRLEGEEAARGDLRTPGGRATVEGFFSLCADELRGPPRVLSAPGFSFSDVACKGGLDHQPRFGGCDRRRRRPSTPSAALSRPLRHRLAGLA